MPNPVSSPFKPAPPVDKAKLEAMAAAATAEAEHLSPTESERIAPLPQAPDLNAELNKVLGKAANTKEVKVKSMTLSAADLEKLDETTLMDYPIEARSLDDDCSQVLKPKDPSKAFRWCYFNNGMLRTSQDKVTAVNVGRYKKWGFEFATADDIQGGEDALLEGIIEDGGKIINYDTVLMKIDKIRLMGHYKKNLLKSLEKVASAQGRAIKTAEGAMMESNTYSRAMAQHPDAKIEFFVPK